MLKQLKGYTNQLTTWQKTKKDLHSVTALLTKGSYIIEEQAGETKDEKEYAVFINYNAYQPPQ